MLICLNITNYYLTQKLKHRKVNLYLKRDRVKRIWTGEETAREASRVKAHSRVVNKANKILCTQCMGPRYRRMVREGP